MLRLACLLVGIGLCSCTPTGSVERIPDDVPSTAAQGPKSAVGSPQGSPQGGSPSSDSVSATDSPVATPIVGNQLSGTWDWLYRGNTQQGDLRIEQEEWHLSQKGNQITGDYLRQVTTLSLDQKPFRCNGLYGFLIVSRVRLVGEVRGDKLLLQEHSAEQEPSPCSDEKIPLRSYEGSLQGSRLSLRHSGGIQQLVRRTKDSKISALTPLEGGGREQLTDSDLVLNGVWDWQSRTTANVDGDIDQHSEREEWHLVDMGGKLAGYYDRIVERSRRSGVFACSGSAQLRSVTRYTLRGRRSGDHFFLNETDYRSEPSACENGGRRVDSYRGTILPQGQLLLEWSGGQQVIKKRREKD